MILKNKPKFRIMRKIISAAVVLSLTVISCKKESGNTGVIKEENKEVTVTNNNGVIDSTASSETYTKDVNGETQEHTYRYVAEDGSSALVKFSNSTKDGNYIAITSNKKTIKVKQKEAWAKGAIYEENGITIKSEGDKVTIEQGGNVIELKKARGQ